MISVRASGRGDIMGTRKVKKLCEEEGVWSAIANQCMYGLRTPRSEWRMDGNTEADKIHDTCRSDFGRNLPKVRRKPCPSTTTRRKSRTSPNLEFWIVPFSGHVGSCSGSFVFFSCGAECCSHASLDGLDSA